MKQYITAIYTKIKAHKTMKARWKTPAGFLFVLFPGCRFRSWQQPGPDIPYRRRLPTADQLFKIFFTKKKRFLKKFFRPSYSLVFAGCSLWCSLWIFAISALAVFALCALFAFRWIFSLSAEIKRLLDEIFPIYCILFSIPCKYAIVRRNISILALVISEIDYIHENDLLEGLKKSV